MLREVPDLVIPPIMGQYKIYKRVQVPTVQKLLIAYRVDSPNNPLYVLKIYNDLQAFRKQKRIFESCPLYQDFFVESCELPGTQFTVSKYSDFMSLFEFVNTFGLLPAGSIRFYVQSLLQQMKIIHQTLEQPYRRLHPQDIIVSEALRFHIVGWGRDQRQCIEREFIEDCGQIMYFMLTRSVTRPTALIKATKKQLMKQNFFSSDTFKKVLIKYKDSFPKTEQELNKLISFLKMTLTNKQTTLEQALNHEYFQNTQSFEQASSALQAKIIQVKAKKKQKQLRDFERKFKFEKKNEQVRGSLSLKEALSHPIDIDFQSCGNQIIEQFDDYCQPAQNNEIDRHPQPSSQSTRPASFPKFIEKILRLRLSEAMKKNQIFEEEWLQLFKFSVNILGASESSVTLGLKCEFKYSESDGIMPECEQLHSQIALDYLVQKEQKQASTSEVSIKVTESRMHPILVYKFKTFLNECLPKLFLISDKPQ